VGEIFRKKLRAAGRDHCPTLQVKAIRAVARFSYLLFLLGVRCPNLFFVLTGRGVIS
jgi:hypothetical protein